MLADLLWPKRCVGCGKLGEYFCDSCWKEVFLLRGRPFKEVISLFSYRGLVGEVIRKLKYRSVTDLVDELAEKTREKVKKENPGLARFLNQDWVMVPVPLHFWKQNQRGFNQAEILGKGLAVEFGWRVETDWLRRRKYTKTQSRLEKKERLENVASAFGLVSSEVLIPEKTKILLFDDVWTTGATMEACSEVLRKAGGKKIWGLTLAR